MLSISENWLLTGWAWVEIGHSLVEHAWKLVTLWLSIHGIWLLVCWAYAEIRFYCNWTMFFPLSSVPLSPFFIPCLTSYVSCLKWLILVSHPLFPVSCLCSLSPILCPFSHFSVPCFPPFFSHSLSPVSCLCSLFPVLCSLSHVSFPCIPSSVPCLASLFLVSHPLFSILRLCSLSPVLIPQCSVSVPCIPSSFLGDL